MKNKVTLGVSIAFATCALLFCPRWGRTQTAQDEQATTSNTSSADAQSMAAQMVPAQAVLDKDLDARKVRTGEQFQASLSDTVHLKSGVDLPRGTTLVGTVAADKMQAGGTSTLALRFTQAQLKDGKTIPIEATIVGIAPPADGSAWDYSDQRTPGAWNGTATQLDVVGAVSGFDLHSRIAGENSGVLVSNHKDNVKLAARTQLSLALGVSSANAMNGGA